TITVLSQASLVTTPWRTRFGMLTPSLGLRDRRAAPLAENGLDAGDVAPHLAHPRGVFELATGALETQVEDLLAERVDLFGQFILTAPAQLPCLSALHSCSLPSRPLTHRGVLRHFRAPNPRASLAS